jgi:pyruvate/2-oxoglutarate dehydrogenase complex dihydrolipoamide dehydrogenase (E3) component
VSDDDLRLLSHVRPPGWRNPAPAARYDLVVLGGGTAGLVCAAGAAGLGARVALVERHRLGGDCLNTGCVPSKALVRSARVVGDARAGASVGVPARAEPDVDAVMRRMRARRADLAPHDSAARLASLGVDVFFGVAAFADRQSVAVRAAGDPGDARLRFRKAVIAAGSEPAVPEVQGLTGTPFLTSDTVFDLPALPRSLVVLGGGPVGCELAQAFARLGTEVTLIQRGPQLLRREDPDAAALVAAALTADGVRLRLDSRPTRVVWDGRRFTLALEGGEVSGDGLLLATGRVPRVEGLDHARAGITAGADGVDVDDGLRTGNPRVYAAGDVCSPIRFTHAADEMARIVVQNALFFGRRRVSSLVVPRCTFTAPQVAHVGVTGAGAEARGLATITVPLAEVDRAVVDQDTAGFVRLHHHRGRIQGATVVAAEAGEIVGTLALAMQHGLGLTDLAATVFPYPTLSSALRRAGDEFRRSRLTAPVRRAFSAYFRVFR